MHSEFEQMDRDPHDECRFEIIRLNNIIKDLIAFMVTGKRDNTGRWMEILVDRINDVCEATGNPDRFKYRYAPRNGYIDRVSSR